MKFKHFFTLTAILIIAFSISGVVASENITSDVSSSESVYLVSDMEDCKLSSEDDSNTEVYSSGEPADLYVRSDVKNVYEGKNYNHAGFEVPWTITAKSNSGTAQNVKVSVKLSDTMQYISHNNTAGAFNSKTGVWSIGDLAKSDSATLIILTKLKSNGIFRVTITGTTDSADIDSSNNFDSLYIRSGTSKFGSNVTETTDDRNAPQHDTHFGSYMDSRFVSRIPEEDPSDDKDPEGGSDNPGDDTGTGDNGKSDGNGNNGGRFIKTAKSIAGELSGTTSYMGTLFGVNSTLSTSQNFLHGALKAISAENYILIPLLIFSIFLIMMASEVVYEKIKS